MIAWLSRLLRHDDRSNHADAFLEKLRFQKEEAEREVARLREGRAETIRDRVRHDADFPILGPRRRVVVNRRTRP
jgi:hypothetical protein